MLGNGCNPASLESAVIRGCYDYAFTGGRKPGIGAGTASLLFLRLLLTYKGSIMYALSEPMGDSIIAPLYKYLRDHRGVRFEFFCRVKKLELSPYEPLVDRVILAQQVVLDDGAAYYDPWSSGRTGTGHGPRRPTRTRSSTATPWKATISNPPGPRGPTPSRNASSAEGHRTATTATRTFLTSSFSLSDSKVSKRSAPTSENEFPVPWGNFLTKIETTRPPRCNSGSSLRPTNSAGRIRRPP